jgi:phenylacetate-CoA ligase
VRAAAGTAICEDHFLPEIIDPETGEVLPETEQEGELVFTLPFTKEGQSRVIAIERGI